MARVRAWLSREWIQVLMITGLTAVMRLVDLAHLPPGLYHDEAYNGLDALRVLEGTFPVFFEANNGREPLFIYLVALAVRLLGRTPLAIRSVAALLGILTIPTTYAMAKEWLGRRVGMMAAAITAATFWHLNLSRVGFRAVGLPLFLGLWLWQCGLALHRSRIRHWVLSGCFLGLALYTYIAARFVPLVIVFWIAYWALRRQLIPWAGLLSMAIAALLVSGPLLLYAWQHLEPFLSRAAQVSVFSPNINGGDLWGTLTQNLLGALGMFVWRGDFIPRHNLPNRPVFDLLIGAAFVVGLYVSLRASRQSQEPALLLCAGVTMLLPSILAENAPHMLRAVGVLPVLFVFPAVGLQAAWDWIGSRWSFRTATLWVVLVLGISLTITVYDYFGRHVRSQDVYYNFESGVSELAVDVTQFLTTKGSTPTSQRQVWLDERLWRDWASLRFLVPESPNLIRLDGNASLPAIGSSVRLIVWPYAELERFLGLMPTERLISARQGPRERGDLEKEVRLLCLVYEATPLPEQVGSMQIPLENGITLWKAEAKQEEGSVRVRLFWQTSQRPTTDYTVFVHLRAADQPLPLAQSDSYPAQGYYRTTLWRPGDTVLDEHTITASLPYQTPLSLDVGMYSLKTMARLGILDAAGNVIGDHVTIAVP